MNQNPELAAAESLAWATRQIENCLSRPIPHLAEPTVGERRTKLDNAIGLVGEIGELIDDAGFGLQGKGYVDLQVEMLLESLKRLRGELQ